MCSSDLAYFFVIENGIGQTDYSVRFVALSSHLRTISELRPTGESILVAAGASHPIPVACVEAGRWHDSGRDFAPADRVSHPESRRRKAVELERAPLMEGVAQHTVWAEIDERLAHTGALSATSAIADVHDVERPRIDAIAEEIGRAHV